MKILVALVALLALVSSAMAWDFTDNLQYTYTKTGSQQAGADIVLGTLNGLQNGVSTGTPTSNAHFYDPGYSVLPATTGTTHDALTTTVIVPASAATVSNTLGQTAVDRVIYYPSIDMTNANFAAQLTQGGDAAVKLHAINDETINALTKNTVDTTPEMQGYADAYQNLALAGGFDKATETNFVSTATVGVDSLFAVTQTGAPVLSDAVTKNGITTYPVTNEANSASVDSQTHGGGMIDSADLGEQVTADVSKDFTNSAWQTAEYSGGIKMWADFTASDPGCSNPIVSTVSGNAWTSLFPTVAGTGFGGNSYWSADPITKFTPFKP